jgi:hypothetical protein
MLYLREQARDFLDKAAEVPQTSTDDVTVDGGLTWASGNCFLYYTAVRIQVQPGHDNNEQSMDCSSQTRGCRSCIRETRVYLRVP